jgi:hypothetical protein
MDVTLTEQALQQPPTPTVWLGGRIYSGLPRVVGPLICQRLVVVDTTLETMPDGTEQLAKGIVTSFDKLLADPSNDGIDNEP